MVEMLLLLIFLTLVGQFFPELLAGLGVLVLVVAVAAVCSLLGVLLYACPKLIAILIGGVLAEAVRSGGSKRSHQGLDGALLSGADAALGSNKLVVSKTLKVIFYGVCLSIIFAAIFLGK